MRLKSITFCARKNLAAAAAFSAFHGASLFLWPQKRKTPYAKQRTEPIFKISFLSKIISETVIRTAPGRRNFGLPFSQGGQQVPVFPFSRRTPNTFSGGLSSAGLFGIYSHNAANAAAQNADCKRRQRTCTKPEVTENKTAQNAEQNRVYRAAKRSAKQPAFIRPPPRQKAAHNGCNRSDNINHNANSPVRQAGISCRKRTQNEQRRRYRIRKQNRLNNKHCVKAAESSCFARRTL